jgi:hypothetical protein
MATLYGSAQAGLSENKSKTERRFYLRSGSEFLHWSGTALTSRRSQAWSGSIEQARACRARFDAAAGCKAIPTNSIIPTALAEEA